MEAIIKQNKEMASAILALEAVDPRAGGQEGTAIEVARRGLGEKADEIRQMVEST